MKRHPRRLLRGTAPGLLLAVLACGGGGGGGSGVLSGPPGGIAGQVLLVGADLGRVIEQEPNDTAAQALRLPPLGPRARLEVSGTLGLTPARYGRADPADAFALALLRPQEVTLTLQPTLLDPVGGLTNLAALEVRDADTGALLAEAAPAAGTRSLVLDATPWPDLVVSASLSRGHAAYTLTIRLSDPPAPAASKPAPPRVPRASPLDAAPAGACAPGHLLVRLRAGADPDAVAARLGLTCGRRTGTGSHCFVLPRAEQGKPAGAMQERARSLQGDPDVLWAEPDWVVRPLAVPSDAEHARQWNLRAVGAERAWDVTRGSPSVRIGIVDSGIVPHPDLEGQTEPGYDFVSDPAFSGDGDGRDTDPTDVGDRELAGGLSTWHGTHVAAIVAARQDGYGVTGLAPDCRVMALRALGIGGGLVSDASDAILFGAGLLQVGVRGRLERPLDVLNLSFGINVAPRELEDACALALAAGVVLVGATGNDLGPVSYPAAFPSVIAVGAVTGGLGATGYSNTGPEVDLVAPGGRYGEDVNDDGWPDGILSAVLDETVYPRAPSHGYLVGTSQAAPHVAAAAALLRTLDPTITPSEVRAVLKGTALDRGEVGPDVVYGAGVLQVQSALLAHAATLSRSPPLSKPVRLPTAGLLFAGLDLTHVVPLLERESPTPLYTVVETDDGLSWLAAAVVESPTGAPLGLSVSVDRMLLPTTPARYAGTVILEGVDGTRETLRVVVLVGNRALAGVPVAVAAQEMVSGIARATGIAHAGARYRYWFPGVPPQTYVVFAGLDTGGDGFFCRGTEPCAYHGGPTLAEAQPVVVTSTAVSAGVDIEIDDP